MRFPLATLLLALGACLTFSTGCHYTPQRTAYVATSTVKVSVETALVAYNQFAKTGHTTVAQNIAVKKAYEQYQLAAALACDAGAVYASTGGTNHIASAAFQTATLNMAGTVEDLLSLLRSFGVKI